MPTSETPLTKQIVTAVEKAHPEVWWLKVVGHPYQRSGIPDLLMCIEGLLIGMEVKHPKPGESLDHARARATGLQRSEVAKIRRAGGTAGVVTSVQEALDLIKAAQMCHVCSTCQHEREDESE